MDKKHNENLLSPDSETSKESQTFSETSKSKESDNTADLSSEKATLSISENVVEKDVEKPSIKEFSEFSTEEKPEGLFEKSGQETTLNDEVEEISLTLLLEEIQAENAEEREDSSEKNFSKTSGKTPPPFRQNHSNVSHTPQQALISPQVIPTGMLLDGRYRLLQLLGEGGMGAVYKAEHVLMQKPVAIKILKQEAAAERDLVIRFTREARLASRISSPHCVTVYDFGQTPNHSLYLVMEYLEGESLREKLTRENELSLQEIFSLLSQLLASLMAAHEIGVIHRDIKPENIMLIAAESNNSENSPNFLKLLDFGIARPHGFGASGLTRVGFTVGTPGYIAPEQALGEAIDHRADLYSVGIIFYEMLLGRRPFLGSVAMEVIATQVSQPAPPPSEVFPEKPIPHPIEAVLLQSLERDPNHRFANALLFQQALENAFQQAGILLEKPSSSGSENVSHKKRMFLRKANKTPKQKVKTEVSQTEFEKEILRVGERNRVLLTGFAFLLGAGLALLLGYWIWAANTAKPLATEDKDDIVEIWLPVQELLREGNAKDALDTLNKLPRKKRYTPEIQSLLALAYSREGDWQDARVATRTASALGGFSQEVLPYLLHEISLATQTKEARQARLLAYELGPEGIDSLFTMLRSPDSSLRIAAIPILATINDPDISREKLLLQAISGAVSCEDRQALVKNLPEQPNQDVINALNTLKTDPGLQDCLQSILPQKLEALQSE